MNAKLSYDNLGAIAEVDKLVDNSGREEVEGGLPGLVEVVGHQGVHTDTQVVVHQQGGLWQPKLYRIGKIVTLIKNKTHY